MKYWSECSDAEKIERIREQVKNCQYELNGLKEFLAPLLSHHHAADGRVMAPIESTISPSRGRVYSGVNSKEEYF